jgi:integration host factor subunit beta
MLRSQLIERLVETHPHLPRSVMEAALNAILNEITDSLAKGSRIEIRGFGSFFGRARQARTGRDPRTGEAVPVFAKRVPRFRASNLLLDRLNRPTTPG